MDFLSPRVLQVLNHRLPWLPSALSLPNPPSLLPSAQPDSPSLQIPTPKIAPFPTYLIHPLLRLPSPILPISIRSPKNSNFHHGYNPSFSHFGLLRPHPQSQQQHPYRCPHYLPTNLMNLPLPPPPPPLQSQSRHPLYYPSSGSSSNPFQYPLFRAR